MYPYAVRYVERNVFNCLTFALPLQVTTTIGYGSPNKANSYSVHGSALGGKEVEATRQNLGWPYEPFVVPEDVKRYVNIRGSAICNSS